MREIRRCPACLTYVYSDARRCHGCGERLGRRRILTRGSWIFIVLAAAGFAIGRGVDLEQEKTHRVALAIEEASRAEMIKAFVAEWLIAGPARFEHTETRDDFRDRIDALRNRYAVLPATSAHVPNVESGESLLHVPAGSGGTGHRPEEARPDLRVSASRASARWPVKLFWHADRYLFRGTFKKGEATYSIQGSVCIDGSKISCLAIEEIRDATGHKVEPRE
jgi:hypothetical protein